MAHAEGVERTLGHLGESADAFVCAVGLERFPPACDDLVGISLVPHVPDNLVGGGIVDIVQGYGKFYSAETGSEMSRIPGAAVYHVPPDLTAQGLKLFDR